MLRLSICMTVWLYDCLRQQVHIVLADEADFLELEYNKNVLKAPKLGVVVVGLGIYL